jgi:sec-independent protein translocase protein TatA
MFGLGPFEILLIGIVALVVFGPKKLPEMGSSLGKAIKNFKSGVSSEETPAPKEIAQQPTLPSGKDS